MNCVPWCLSAIALLCSQTLYICEHNSSRLLLSWTRFSTLITNQWFSIWTWFEAQFGIEPKNLCVVQFYPRGEFLTTANVTAWTPSFLPLGINFSASTTRTTFWQQIKLKLWWKIQWKAIFQNSTQPLKECFAQKNKRIWLKNSIGVGFAKNHHPTNMADTSTCNSFVGQFSPFKLCFFLLILVHT